MIFLLTKILACIILISISCRLDKSITYLFATFCFLYQDTVCRIAVRNFCGHALKEIAVRNFCGHALKEIAVRNFCGHALKEIAARNICGHALKEIAVRNFCGHALKEIINN